MTHCVCRYWASAALFFVFIAGTLQADEGTAGSSIEPVRVALIDRADRPEFSVLLEAACMENPGIHMLDRSKLLLLFREQHIQELLDNRNWRDGGRILNAEMLVIVAAQNGTGGGSNLLVRIIGANTGMVLAEHHFAYNPQSLVAQVQRVYAFIHRELPRSRLNRDECLVLSAPALAGEVYSSALLGIERKVTLELLNLLANHPKIILLERAFLDSVTWEQSLSGRDALATSKAVLNGTIALDNGMIKIEGSLMIAGREPAPISAEAPIDSTEKLARNVVDLILAASDIAQETPWKPAEEAAFYAQVAKSMLHHGLVPEAAAAADSAFALGCRDRQLLNARIKAHSLLAYPIFWHGHRFFAMRRSADVIKQVIAMPVFQDVRNERWRVSAAVRSIDAIMDAFPHMDQEENVPFEEDFRVIGATACRNACRILLSADAMSLTDVDTNGQISYLREQIRKSLQDLQAMPQTDGSFLVWYATGHYLGLLYDNLDERFKAYVAFLERTPAPNRGKPWQGIFTPWNDMMSISDQDDFPRHGPLRLSKKGMSAEYSRLLDAGPYNGQIYAWEPNVLERRERWLAKIVTLTHATEIKEREVGWMLWKLWLDTQLCTHIQGDYFNERWNQHDWIKAEHPTFDWKAEARKAWNLSPNFDLVMWTDQQLESMTWDMRDDFVTREHLSFGAGNAYATRFLSVHGDTFKWLKYFATDAPNIPHALLWYLIFKWNREGFIPAVSDQHIELLLACRARLDKIGPRPNCATPVQIDEMLSEIAAIRDRTKINTDRGRNETPPPPRKKPPVTVDPSKIYISPEWIILKTDMSPPGTRPPAETESAEWWKIWRYKCVWDKVEQYEGSNASGPFIRAYDPASKDSWIISLPEKLREDFPNPSVMIDADAIYLLGDQKIAYWKPGKQHRIINMPGKRAHAQLVDGKLYALFSGEDCFFGLGYAPGQGGAVYEYDPETDALTLLVSSRRMLAKTILDNCPPYDPMFVFKDREDKLNLIVRPADGKSLKLDVCDRIYRQDSKWDWTLVRTLESSNTICSFSYTHRGGRNFIWTIPRISARWEEWGILPGENELIECIYRHPGLDPVFGFFRDIPNDNKTPAGSYVYRDGKRYYMNRPQIDVYDEKERRTTTLELRREFTPDQESYLKRMGINSSMRQLFDDDVDWANQDIWATVESGVAIYRTSGSQKIYGYVPWPTVDTTHAEQRRKDDENERRLLAAVQFDEETGKAQHMAGVTNEGLADSSPSPEHHPGEEMAVDLGGGVVLEMIWIPGGSFIMGSHPAEQNRFVDERLHRVTLSNGFWVGKYEVTQEHWEQIMDSNPSRFIGTSNPVENVSWYNCQEFIQRLNAKIKQTEELQGAAFSLPTEAQWEYACRAGSTTAFHYGNALDSSMANFEGNYPYGGASTGENRKQTMPVGSFAPNRWGLYDMHGNVEEWCQDRYERYAAGTRVTDPTGPQSGMPHAPRVIRGGGWINSGGFCRSAIRGRSTPNAALNYLGLRPVMTYRYKPTVVDYEVKQEWSQPVPISTSGVSRIEK